MNTKYIKELISAVFKPLYESLTGEKVSNKLINQWVSSTASNMIKHMIEEKEIVCVLKWLTKKESDQIFWIKQLCEPKDLFKKTKENVYYFRKMLHLAKAEENLSKAIPNKEMKEYFQHREKEIIQRSKDKKFVDKWVKNNPAEYKERLKKAKEISHNKYISEKSNDVYARCLVSLWILKKYN